jgi:hypothetical protein
MLAEASTVAEECISSARTVRMFSSERASIKEYDIKVDLSYQVGKILAIAGGKFHNRMKDVFVTKFSMTLTCSLKFRK